MNFIFTPTLEHRALVKTATMLWSGKDVRDRLLQLYSSDKTIWRGIEDIVVKGASELPLTGILKDKLFRIIEPVGLQIQSWIEFHSEFNVGNYLAPKLPPVLFWTPQGTVDKRRTAEVLVRDETIDIHERFKLSCNYCLIDDILSLWQSCCPPRSIRLKDNIFQNLLVVFWNVYIAKNRSFVVSRRLNNNFNLCQFAFKYSAIIRRNEVATKFFWFNLNSNFSERIVTEMDKILHILNGYTPTLRWIVNGFAEVLFFILSTMNEEQLTDIFRRNTYSVLKCLLVWPWESMFLETAKDKFDFLSKENYENLLHEIVDRMSKYNNLHEILGEFWQLTPNTFKEFLFDQDGFRWLLGKLYLREDIKNIILILKDTSISAKKRLVSREESSSARRERTFHATFEFDEINLKWDDFLRQFKLYIV